MTPQSAQTTMYERPASIRDLDLAANEAPYWREGDSLVSPTRWTYLSEVQPVATSVVDWGGASSVGTDGVNMIAAWRTTGGAVDHALLDADPPTVTTALPDGEFTVDPAVGVTFTIEGSDTLTDVRVLWDFGDGTVGEGSTVTHRFAPGGPSSSPASSWTRGATSPAPCNGRSATRRPHRPRSSRCPPLRRRHRFRPTRGISSG